jgi:hypothetical protein
MIFSENKLSKTEFDYMILIPGRSFSTDFVISLTNTTSFLNHFGYTHYISIKSYPIISSLRNLLISQNITDGVYLNINPNLSNSVFDNKIKINKKILMFDSDISWSINDLKLLIENDNDITVGAYQLTTGNTSLHSLEDKPVTPEDFRLQEHPFEVISSGLGFAAIKQEVFENIKYPWFEVNEGDSYHTTSGEDYNFFQKARKSGYKIICDPKIKLGHIKQQNLYIN